MASTTTTGGSRCPRLATCVTHLPRSHPRHTTRAPSPTSQHTPPDRHAPSARHTRPLHTHLTTPYLLPFILYLYICTSPRPPAARCDPILSSPLLPFRTASHPSSARTHLVLSTSQLSFYTPSHPSSMHPPLPLLQKSLHSPRLKQAVTHLWKSFVPKEEEHLSSTSYPYDTVWITL